MSQKNILVTGATGRQGQTFISALRDCDYFHILALTRNPSSRQAKWLASASKVTIIEGDLDSEAFIRSMFEGRKEGENAKSNGGSIWLFRGSALMQAAKRDKEKSGDNTLRTGFFTENYEGIVGAVTVSVLKAGLSKDTMIELVCVDDIGHVAVGVFRASCQDPALYAFQILGEVSTIFEQEDVFRRRTCRDLPSVPVFVRKILLAINGHTQGLVADIKRVYRARITGECPDEDGQMAATQQVYQDMTTFAKWAELRRGPSVNRSQGWNRVTIRKLLSGRQ
ncbi:hypothetical protein EDD85DRAFT_786660 [Armillaria nabsnona]|nr:hypothetical protein EDD85DRAFT_786660 [Armillaria nabsnona]